MVSFLLSNLVLKTNWDSHAISKTFSFNKWPPLEYLTWMALLKLWKFQVLIHTSLCQLSGREDEFTSESSPGCTGPAAVKVWGLRGQKGPASKGKVVPQNYDSCTAVCWDSESQVWGHLIPIKYNLSSLISLSVPKLSIFLCPGVATVIRVSEY